MRLAWFLLQRLLSQTSISNLDLDRTSFRHVCMPRISVAFSAFLGSPPVNDWRYILIDGVTKICLSKLEFAVHRIDLLLGHLATGVFDASSFL
jgi:hypothetical protein